MTPAELKAIEERWEHPAPTGQEDPTCACCQYPLDVSGIDWNDGDLCDECGDRQSDVDALIIEVKRLREQRDAARIMAYNLAGEADPNLLRRYEWDDTEASWSAEEAAERGEGR